MNGCSLIFHLYPRCECRHDEISAVLRLLDLQFPNDGWIDRDNCQLRGDEDVRASVVAAKPIDFEQFGVTWCAKTTGNDPIIIIVVTGGDEYSLNSFRIDFSRQHGTPTPELFLEVVELVNPFEAFYYFEIAEQLLRENVHEFGTKRFRIKSLRCVHYVDSATIASICELRRFMEIPNSKKTRMPNGILLEFQAESLGGIGTNDVRDQLEAMKWLGMLEQYRCE